MRRFVSSLALALLVSVMPVVAHAVVADTVIQDSSGVNHVIEYKFRENGTTEKGKIIYEGSNGTGSKYFTFDNQAADGIVLYNSNSTPIRYFINGTDVGGVTANGHYQYRGLGTPTVGSGSTDCGTSPSISGNDNLASVTVGSSTNGGKCTVSFNQTRTGTVSCFCQNVTTGHHCTGKSTSTTGTELTGRFAAGDVLQMFCAER